MLRVKGGLVLGGVLGDGRLEGGERIAAAEATAMLSNEAPPGRLGEVVGVHPPAAAADKIVVSNAYTKIQPAILRLSADMIKFRSLLPQTTVC